MPIELADDQAPVEVADELVEKASQNVSMVLLTPLQRIEHGLAALRADARAFDLTKPDDERAARAFRLRCVKTRTALDAAYDDANAPVQVALREARKLRDRIKADVEAIEGPVDAAIKRHEAALEAARERKRQAEADRVEEIGRRISLIRATTRGAAKLGTSELDEKIKLVAGLTIDAAGYGEFVGQAEAARAESLETLRELHARAAAAEALAAELAEERAKVERERTALEAAQKAAAAERAEADRQAARARAEQDRIAAEQRAEADRLARAEIAAAEERAAEALAAARKAERERREKEQAERQAQAQREAEERARLEAEQCRRAAADKRLHDAAQYMLDALRRIVAMATEAGAYGIADAAQEAIALATGPEGEER